MKKKKIETEEVNPITAKLSECIKYIQENMNHFKSLETWERYDFEEAANSLGFTLVKTGSLSDFYSIQEFCDKSNFEFINHNF